MSEPQNDPRYARSGIASDLVDHGPGARLDPPTKGMDAGKVAPDNQRFAAGGALDPRYKRQGDGEAAPLAKFRRYRRYVARMIGDEKEPLGEHYVLAIFDNNSFRNVELRGEGASLEASGVYIGPDGVAPPKEARLTFSEA